MSLRDRKRVRLRARLVKVSQDLFLRQGYDATTLGQICNEAETAPQTLLRHFESKQQLAVYPYVRRYEQFVEELAAARAQGAATVSFWRSYTERNAQAAASANALRLNELVSNTPALTLVAAEVFLRYEATLAEALAAEAGAPTDDVHSRLLAKLLVEAVSMGFRDNVGRVSTKELPGKLVALVDYVVANFARPAPTGARRRAR